MRSNRQTRFTTFSIFAILFFFFSIISGLGKAESADYYVRPLGGHYGLENGSSYENAFNGWPRVIWGYGQNSVSAGDTLYVCGAHSYSSSTPLGNSGAIAGNETSISGDCPGDPGSITFADENDAFYITRSHFKITDLVINSAENKYTVYVGDVDNILLQNNTINGGAWGVYISTGAGNTPTDIIIDKNTFNDQHSRYAALAAGVEFFGTGPYAATLERCIISNNIFNNSGGHAVHIRAEDDSPDTIVKDLTVTNNHSFNSRSIAFYIFMEDKIAPVNALWSGLSFTDNRSENDASSFVIGGFFKATDWGTNTIARNSSTGSTASEGCIDLFYSKYVEIHDNSCANSSTNYIDGNGILIDYYNDYVRIYRNKISNMNGKYGIENSGVGIMLLDSGHVDVFNNEINGCRIGLWYGDVDSTLNWPSTSRVYNNTFADNTVAGVWIDSTLYSQSIDGIILKNNIFTGNGAYYGINDNSLTSEDIFEDYNLFYNFTTTFKNHTIGNHSLIANPGFTNSTDSNYYPGPNSAAIDTGENQRELVTDDMVGNIRPVGISYDIGAYEYKDPNAPEPGIEIETLLYNDQTFLQLTFTGVLQQSFNGIDWEDIIPQPESPYLTPADHGFKLYRTRE